MPVCILCKKEKTRAHFKHKLLNAQNEFVGEICTDCAQQWRGMSG